MAATSTDHGFAGEPWLRLTWVREDRHRVVTVLSLVALIVAGGMALFGLPPVDLHGPLHQLGVMDPLCGGTRAARYAMRAEFGQAWRYNPLGLVVVFAAGASSLRAGVGSLSGRWLTVVTVWTPRRRRLALVLGLLLVVLLSVRQQLRADLLLAGT